MVRAVDLDGTLAHYDKWEGVDKIGEPIPEMVDRVKGWISDGDDVRIFTARVNSNQDANKIKSARYWIEIWCLKNLGKILPITAEKAFDFDEMWDDRAIHVEKNTGKILG